MTRATIPILFFLFLTILIYSCQEKTTTISPSSLNRSDGLFKFREEPYTGKVLDTTKTGRVLLTFNCINGKPNGEFIQYYEENGSLRRKITYENGEQTGLFLSLSKNGDTISWGNFLNNRKSGLWKEFDKNGILKSVGYYQDGLQNGEWKYYFSNGRIKTIGKYKNGDKSKLGITDIPISGRYGQWIFYNEETGKIEQKCEFEDGMSSGEVIIFHPNGQIDTKGTFKMDKPDGTFETFDENGNLKSKEIWVNGNMISQE